MSNIKIVVDSACDMPRKYLENNNVKILPFRIIVDQTTYLDGVDINNKQLINFIEEKRHITTSQVRVIDFENIFKECAKEKLKCIYLAFSSKMSGAYQSAKVVADNTKEIYPNFEIEILDTQCGSTAIGLLVQKAIQFENDNLSFQEIVKNLRNISEKIEHIFTLNDLESLKTGGRINKTTAFVGNLFNIKPILEVKKGKIQFFKKVRGYNKAYDKIIKIMEERGSNLKNQLIGISYSGKMEYALKLKDMIMERFGTTDFMINMISNVLTVHLGKDGVGVFFIND